MTTLASTVITNTQRVLRDTSGRRYTSAILLACLNDVLNKLSRQVKPLVTSNYRLPLRPFVNSYTLPSDLIELVSLCAMLDPLAITNADFSTTAQWTGTGWTIAVGGATHTAGTDPLSQNVTGAVVGEPWRVGVTISGASAGSVTVSLCAGVAGTAISSNGETVQVLNAGDGNSLTITPTADFDGVITKVRLLRNLPTGVYELKKVSRPIKSANTMAGVPVVWFSDESAYTDIKISPYPSADINQSDLVLTYQKAFPVVVLDSDTLDIGIPDSIWNVFHYGLAAEAVMSSEDPQELAFYERWSQFYNRFVVDALASTKNSTTNRILPGRRWNRGR